MKRSAVALTFQQYYDDKKNGVKRTPLYTLQECCEAADIEPRVFGRWAAQYPGAPQPVLTTPNSAYRCAIRHYRKHEFVKWVNNIRNQKEKTMPDIKTALENALKKTTADWAADDEPHQAVQPQQEKPVSTPTTQPQDTHADKRIKSNVSRATFFFVRDNPGQTSKQIVDALTDAGHNINSVLSLLNQMTRSRIIMMDEYGRYSAVAKEYVPPQKGVQKKRKPKAKAPVKATPAPAPEPEKPKHKQIVLVNRETGKVLNPQINPPAPAVTGTPEWNVDSVIGNLNVRQAMMVYEELRKIFGA